MSDFTKQVTVMTTEGCLHCAVHTAIADHLEKYAEKNVQGLPVLDAADTISNLSKVIADVVFQVPAGSQRRQWKRYAKQCLVACFLAKETGAAQVVDTGEPEKVH